MESQSSFWAQIGRTEDAQKTRIKNSRICFTSDTPQQSFVRGIYFGKLYTKPTYLATVYMVTAHMVLASASMAKPILPAEPPSDKYVSHLPWFAILGGTWTPYGCGKANQPG
jgi:hypothetical protein